MDRLANTGAELPSARRGRRRDRPARDLATQAQEHLLVRQVFVKHAMTRFGLIGAFVITLNLFVQVRGDIGLAVLIAQNLTFGAVAVIVLLNLLSYIMIVVMVTAMPLVFDPRYNTWARVVGAVILVLLAIVFCYTVSWLVLAVLFVVFVVIGTIVRTGRRKPVVPLTRSTIVDVLRTPTAPRDSELREVWARGRAMLRATGDAVPVTVAERAQDGSAEPLPFAEAADAWNERVAAIQEPRTSSITRLAFAGIIGFVALFSVNIVTQPIRFAPLELVTLKGQAAAPGFVLLQSGRGVFVPNPFGTVQFIEASDIEQIQLCEDDPQWWSVSVVDLVYPAAPSGVTCSGASPTSPVNRV